MGYDLLRLTPSARKICSRIRDPCDVRHVIAPSAEDDNARERASNLERKRANRTPTGPIPTIELDSVVRDSA